MSATTSVAQAAAAAPQEPGVSAPPTAALTSVRRAPHPRVCAALSVLPGLGQLATGQLAKALHYLLWTLVPLGGALGLLVGAFAAGRGLIANGAAIWAMLLALVAIAAFLAVLVLGLFVWASAAVDAHHSAAEIRSGSPPAPRPRYFHW